MPRYFFHTSNGLEHRDESGVELRDLQQAQHEAVVMLANIAKDAPGDFLKDGHLQLCLMDASGLLLLELMLVATKAPAAKVGT